MSDKPTTVVQTPKPAQKPAQKPKIQPPYNVVLLNDNDHTYDYVIDMLRKLFGHTKERGFQMADEVHHTGRVIVDTSICRTRGNR